MKRILATALSVILIATMAISGSVAYLQDEDEAVNVMVMGNVGIEQHEQQRNTDPSHDAGDTWNDGDLEPFEQQQGLYPVVYNGTGEGGNEGNDPWVINDYAIGDKGRLMNLDYARNYIDKIVTVENTSTSDAYVRTIFAIPTGGWEYGTYEAADNWLHWNVVHDGLTTPNNGWHWGEPTQVDSTDSSKGMTAEVYPSTGKWDVVPGVEIDGIEYDLYIATNKYPLEAGKSTAPSMLGLYVDKYVDNDGDQYYYKKPNEEPKLIEGMLDENNNLTVLVATQAVQVEGFTDAWTALDEAFGDITPNYHPWYGREDINGAAGVADEADFLSNLESGGNVELSEDIELKGLTTPVNKPTTLNLNNNTLSANRAVESGMNAVDISVLMVYADTTIDGNGTIENKQDGYGITLDKVGATLTIENGSFKGGTSAIQVTNGTLLIKGGYFEDTETSDNGHYLINCIDSNYRNKTANVVITGGTFKNWNPGANASETSDNTTNFLAQGYTVKEYSVGNDTYYTVVKKGAGEAIPATHEESLGLALGAGQNVQLTESFELNNEVAMTASATLDGNGQTMTRSTEENSADTTNYGVTVKGNNTIKNITITGDTYHDSGNTSRSFRAVYGSGVSGDINIENATLGGVYAINVTGEGKLTVKDSTLKGWTSGGLTENTYSNCTFEEWKDTTLDTVYKTLRIYKNTTLDRCTLATGMDLSTNVGEEDLTLTLSNCYMDDGTTRITAENFVQLFDPSKATGFDATNEDHASYLNYWNWLIVKNKVFVNKTEMVFTEFSAVVDGELVTGSVAGATVNNNNVIVPGNANS